MVLDRLALGSNGRYHRPGNPHLDIRSDFEFELSVVDNARDLADQASCRNHAVALADILDEIFLLLRLFALRPDDQKISDNENDRERNQRQDNIRPRRAPRAAGGLGKADVNKILSLLESPLKACPLKTYNP